MSSTMMGTVQLADDISSFPAMLGEGVSGAAFAGSAVASVATAGVAACAVTCAISAAAICATTALPLYAAYKAGKTVYNISTGVIASRIEDRNREEIMKANELQEQKRIKNEVEEFFCSMNDRDSNDVDLLEELELILNQMSVEDANLSSVFLSAENARYSDLLNSIRQEITLRGQRREMEAVDQRAAQMLADSFVRHENCHPARFSYKTKSDSNLEALREALENIAFRGATPELCQKAHQQLASGKELSFSKARAVVLENSLTEIKLQKTEEEKRSLYSIYRELADYVDTEARAYETFNAFNGTEEMKEEISALGKTAEQRLKNGLIYAAYLEDAQKTIVDSDEAKAVADSSYTKLAFAEELRALNLITSADSQEFMDPSNQRVRIFESGTQKLKEITLSDGSRIIQLLTPPAYSKEPGRRKAIQSCQRVKCRQYEVLRKNLSERWGIIWQPEVITDSDCLQAAEESRKDEAENKGAYFNTSSANIVAETIKASYISWEN